ncbi:hypothetical protein GE061_008809 [Apolygus lucorum]|uniref:VLRF1 domain-containing protein n=1 Tax=Apolygus lucorum TaxID=248454 RepID=A0A8S9WNN8_APOLU|nr:hypothetical protein GE061_008809 [Apolygus lucorum]
MDAKTFITLHVAEPSPEYRGTPDHADLRQEMTIGVVSERVPRLGELTKDYAQPTELPRPTPVSEHFEAWRKRSETLSPQHLVRTLNEGETVYVKKAQPPPGTTRRCWCPWTGPWIVTKRRTDSMYEIRDPPDRRRQMVHRSRLKPVFMPKAPGDTQCEHFRPKIRTEVHNHAELHECTKPISSGPRRCGEAILHKTFHSYTVRKAQGGSQSTKDNKGTHSKSAGSSLRRYNEQSLAQHIQELMKTWGPDIVKCDLIFYRAVGRSNMSSLFGGPSAPLLKSDPRLRTIPFPTRRPTFNEVQRVHSLLALTFIYDSNEMFKTSFPPVKIPRDEVDEKDKRRSKRNGETPESGSAAGSPRKSHIDRGKERPSPVRELPGIVQQLAAISTSGSEGDTMFMMEEEVSFLDLREFEDTVPQEIKDRVNMKKRKKKKKTETGPEKGQ